MNEIKDVNINGITLTDKDFHCMARILQSCIFAKDKSFLYGCEYCKYSYDCLVKNNHNLSSIRKKLNDLTGVYLGFLMYSNLEDNFKDDVSIQKLNPKEYEELQKFFEKLNKNN